LNGEEYVSNLRGKIVCDMRPGVNVSRKETSEAKKNVKCSMGAWSTIGYFLEPDKIDALSKLNRKARLGSLNEQCTTNLEAIKNYKKANIAQKTHENIVARRRQVQGQGYKRQRLNSR